MSEAKSTIEARQHSEWLQQYTVNATTDPTLTICCQKIRAGNYLQATHPTLAICCQKIRAGNYLQAAHPTLAICCQKIRAGNSLQAAHWPQWLNPPPLFQVLELTDQMSVPCQTGSKTASAAGMPMTTQTSCTSSGQWKLHVRRKLSGSLNNLQCSAAFTSRRKLGFPFK